MFSVLSRFASLFFDLMTPRQHFKNIWGAIIPLLLCSWILFAQAIPTSNPTPHNQKFRYDLDASKTPVFLPGQSAIFECAEHMPPDTLVQWLKDGILVGFSSTSVTKKRQKTIHEKQGLPLNSRRSRSRHQRSLKTSIEPDTQTHDMKSTSKTSSLTNITNDYFTVWSNGSLRVLNVNQTHAGEYKCFMQDSHGRRIRRKFNIIIADLPQCTIQPSKISAHVSSAARLFCSTNIPTAVDVTYTWTKDGQALPNDHKRFEHVQNGALHFYNLTFEDAGSYQCHIASSLGFYTSKAAFLTILPQTHEHNELRFIVEPQNITVFPPRHRAIFECLVNDPNRTYSWTKRNGKICNYHCPLGVSLSNLILNNVPVKGVPEYSSSDFYTCRVRPINSREAVSKTAYLNVLEKPSISVYASGSKVRLSQQVQFSCTAAGGNPSPKIYWTKNGDILDPKEGTGNVEINLTAGRLYLRIGSVESSDSGYYQCVGENIAGSNAEGIRLDAIKTIYVPPPVDVVAMPVSESEIFVKWHHPADFDGILSYEIRYSPGRGGHPCPKTATNFTLTGLRPYTEYTIKVIAYARKGPSEPTIVHARTNETKPCGTIQTVDLKPYVVNSTTIFFIWPSLPRPFQCGIVTNYKVTCSLYSIRGELVSDTNYSDSVFQVKARQYPHENQPVTEFILISGLVPEGLYVLDVAPATRAGEGIESGLVDVELPAARNVACLKNGESAFLYTNGYFYQDLKHLIVVWMIKPIHSFVVKIDLVLADNEQITHTQTVNSSSKSVVFGAVNGRKPYVVVVSLFKPDNDQCESRSFAVVYEDDAEDGNIPTNIRGSSAGRGCVRLDWDYEQEFDLEVSFVVRYELYRGSAHKNSVKFQNSNATNALVCDLQPWSSYEFSVAAIYSFESISENTTFARLTKAIWTLEEEPGVPADFYCLDGDVGEIECVWTEPANPNGEITTYVLMYRGDGQEDWNNITTAETSAIVNCLQPEERHIFKVYAVNSAGAGESSIVTKDVMKYAASERNCTFERNTKIETPGGPSIEAVLMGIGIAVLCIIVCVILLCFCLPGRQAKFALYRSGYRKRHAKQNGTNNKADGLHHVTVQSRKQNGCTRNGYHSTDAEEFDEQQVNLLPKNGVAVPVSNGSAPKNGCRKQPIVKKNGIHKENSQSKLLNGVTKQNGTRNENGAAGNTFRLDPLRRQKLEKRAPQLIPESNSHSNHNQHLILSIPIPKHCGKAYDTPSLGSDNQDPDTSQMAKHRVSFSDVD